MIHGEAAPAHHLLKIAVRELRPAIPPDAQKDDRRLEVATLKGGLVLLHEDDPQRVLNEPGENSRSKAFLATEPFWGSIRNGLSVTIRARAVFIKTPLTPSGMKMRNNFFATICARQRRLKQPVR
jgi:hypothetical protein